MIEINSRQLNNYLTYKLDKLEEQYTEEELKQVDELVIENDMNLDLSVLKYFENLKTLEMRNLEINDNTLNIILSLNSLTNLRFQLCEIENISKIKDLNLTSLHLDCCKIKNYEFIYELINLQELTLTGVEIDINKLNNLTNLKYLNISHSTCTNDILDIQNLEHLYIDNSYIIDINFTENLANLKELSLSNEQYEDKKELIERLKQKEVEILDYSIMLLGEI